MMSHADVTGLREEPFSAAVSPELADQASDIFPVIQSLIDSEQNTTDTVCHGDFRLANFGLGRDGRLRLFDWQCCHYGSALFDVTWFFSTQSNFNVDQIDRFLKVYHSALSDKGVTIKYSSIKEQFDHAIAMLWAVFLILPTFFHNLDTELSQIMFGNIAKLLAEFQGYQLAKSFTKT